MSDSRLKFLVIILLFMTACARINPEVRKTSAIELAEAYHFSPRYFDTTYFRLQTFFKSGSKNTEELTVYIEGDGLAWRRKNKLSTDPTPITPVALQLAVSDPASNVLYIARPCQFLSKVDLQECDIKYWSSHRYAEEVVSSINEVINKVKNKTNSKKIKVYGYSGGGVVAALLSRYRQDLSAIITIAANLDHNAWTEHHSVSPLSGSLDLNNYLDSLTVIPQLHFVGSKDKVVPKELTQTFLIKMGSKAPARLVELPEFDHQCCWTEEWPRLLKDNQF